MVSDYFDNLNRCPVLVGHIGNYMHHPQNKENAIFFRKRGNSLREIAKITNISRSTLSIWLSNIEIDPEGQIRILRRKISAQKKSAKILRNRKLERRRQ